ncbi:MAG: amidohydrolase family protein [Kofleriaceae bacterium]
MTSTASHATASHADARRRPAGARARTLALALAAAALSLAALGDAARAQTVAITGATVYPTPERKLEGATVLLRDGVITALGVGVTIPADATRLDASGKIVTAGLIESASQLGLVEIQLERSSSDGRFGTTPTEIHAAFRAVDAFDARAVAIPIARTGGVTSAIVGPRGGLLAGQAAWVPLDDAARPAPPIRAPAAMIAALGPSAIEGGSRGQAVERLREVLDDAAQYERTRAAYDRNQSRKLVGERLDLEALRPVLRGQIPLIIAADAESDVRAALALAKERRLRLVIAGGAEAWRVADELAAERVAVIVDPTDNLPGELYATDVRDDNAAVLAMAGVQVAISTLGDASAARTIRQLAGIAVSNGLPWERGLAALTTVPAAIFGKPARGQLAVGGPADLVIWTGDPLELTSRAEHVFIGGVAQSMRTHQSRLLERYRRLPFVP